MAKKRVSIGGLFPPAKEGNENKNKKGKTRTQPERRTFLLIASCLTCLVSRHPRGGGGRVAEYRGRGKLWWPPPLSDRERGKRGGRKLKVVLIERCDIRPRTQLNSPLPFFSALVCVSISTSGALSLSLSLRKKSQR